MSIRKETGVSIPGAGGRPNKGQIARGNIMGYSSAHKTQWVYTDTEGEERYYDTKREAMDRENQDAIDNGGTAVHKPWTHRGSKD